MRDRTVECGGGEGLGGREVGICEVIATGRDRGRWRGEEGRVIRMFRESVEEN